MVLEHPSRSALDPPPITSSRISAKTDQPATVCAESGRGTTTSRTTTRASNELSPPKSACSGDTVLRTSTRGTVMGQCGPEDSISQCPFLQMIDTAGNPHADGRAAPGALPRHRPSRHCDPPATSHTHDNWMAARQTSCRQQTAPPQPRCSKDVTAHPHRPGARPGRPARSPPAAGSRCPAGADSAPHSEQNFYLITTEPSKERGTCRTAIEM